MFPPPDDTLVSVWCEDFPAQFIEILTGRSREVSIGHVENVNRGLSPSVRDMQTPRQSQVDDDVKNEGGDSSGDALRDEGGRGQRQATSKTNRRRSSRRTTISVRRMKLLVV